MTTDIPPLSDEAQAAINAYKELRDVLAVPREGQKLPADRTWDLPPFGAVQDLRESASDWTSASAESETTTENEGT